MPRPGKHPSNIDIVKRALAKFPDIACLPVCQAQALPDDAHTRCRFEHVDVNIYPATRDRFEYLYPGLVS